MARGFPSHDGPLGPVFNLPATRTGISSLKCSAVRYRKVGGGGAPGRQPGQQGGLGGLLQRFEGRRRRRLSRRRKLGELVDHLNGLAKGMLGILGLGLAPTSPLPQTIYRAGT